MPIHSPNPMQVRPRLVRGSGTVWSLWLAAVLALTLSACGGGGGGGTSNASDSIPLAALGQRLFTDSNLSEPRGTACAACHRANMGFAGNNGSTTGVARGSTTASLGLRNAMTNSYAQFIPPFEFTTLNGDFEAVGGLFWDGRVNTLAEQALGPLLNALEMNNPNKRAVVDKVAASNYAQAFRDHFGADIFSSANTELAFSSIGQAIAAFESSPPLNSFSSKYDAMVRRQTTLTAPESRGMALFMDPAKGNCAACHVMNPNSGRPEDSLFTEFTYYATGVPRNPDIRRNADPTFYDLGLCGPDRTAPSLPAQAPAGLTIDNFCGKFRMSTLRNVAERPAFMHNGFFKSLRDVVEFYATRNSNPGRWYGGASVSNDLPARYLANVETAKPPFNRAASAGPALTSAEIDDVVSFLRTLSDGWQPPSAP
jgi:cytochrome c peroxidase